jgi:hypothetical protein
LVCLAVNLHGFYRALTAYAARATFPNELYVEVQRWDYLTNLMFQGRLATPASLFVLFACIALVMRGSTQLRGFALSVLGFQMLMVVITLAYVYSGVRWSQPLPVYFEYAALPVYIVTGFLGLWFAHEQWGARTSGWLRRALMVDATPRHATVAAYLGVLVLPAMGMMMVAAKAQASPAESAPPAVAGTQGIMPTLREELAIRPDGVFRGSVATIAAVPGGEVMNRYHVPADAPYNKEMLSFGWGNYLRTFDPDLFMTGLWNSRIPTLEDNNHLVTPPFHFLVSRALSRPQDFHSRNWAVITKANPRLMAALGARFLLRDAPEQDPLLSPRMQQRNTDGVTLYLYEIAHPNLANYSPTRTIRAGTAAEILARMTDPAVDLSETAIIDDSVSLPGLTRAQSGSMSFEKGGVRIRAASRGPSLLVLPLQFSNSLQVISQAPTDSPVRLVRVNLLETGVLFTGDLDLKIAHVFGPFRDVSGRQRDIADTQRLGIKETGEIPYPPGYQPLAVRKSGR